MFSDSCCDGAKNVLLLSRVSVGNGIFCCWIPILLLFSKLTSVTNASSLPPKFKTKFRWSASPFEPVNGLSIKFFSSVRRWLLSTNSNKGKAIKALKKYSKIQNIQIIGLGDSPNDLPLLLNSDIRIVIPGKDGPNLHLLDQLKDSEFILATEPNGYGWKSEINKLINNLELT